MLDLNAAARRAKSDATEKRWEERLSDTSRTLKQQQDHYREKELDTPSRPSAMTLWEGSTATCPMALGQTDATARMRACWAHRLLRCRRRRRVFLRVEERLQTLDLVGQAAGPVGFCSGGAPQHLAVGWHHTNDPGSPMTR